jgi:hypothetical protein
MRTLMALGVLAVATALLGRTFGLHDVRFLASEVALLVSMFVISRYVEGDWRVIHDASLGRGNVDHILIGPPGVFTIETKSHPGPVRVARVHGAVLKQAQAQRRAIERVTQLEVEPLIVFSRAWVDRPMARRKGVRVVPARMLLGYLSKRPARLSGREVEGARTDVAEALREWEAQARGADERWRRIR